MKNILIVFTCLALIACSNKEYVSYGELIEDKTSASYISVLESAMEDTLENVVLEGEIIQTCAKKGCWMDVKIDNRDTIMVRFKDYGFFVPIEGVEGNRVVFRGNAMMDTLSVDMLRHYAEDAGKSESEIMAITDPVFELKFIADGVLIEQ